LALHNYHDAHKIFPPSSHWPPGNWPETPQNTNLRENWVIMILPFIEEENLYDQFLRTQPISDPVNATARATRLSVMICPSDVYTEASFNGNLVVPGLGGNWARGCYAANAAAGYMARGSGTCPHLNGAGCCALPDSDGWKQTRWRGVMGANSAQTIARITDGTSMTILVAEIRAGIHEADSRGVWAMSGACPSALWGHGVITDANGPNAPWTRADDPEGCFQVEAAYGGQAAVTAMGMPCTGGNANFQQAARSMHAGGIHACFADGSVRFIGDFIQLGTAPNNLGVWDRINLSADGVTLDSASF
jgi:prepilin-type processing-associated H-X9-DG protein